MHYPVDLKLFNILLKCLEVWIKLKIYLTGEVIHTCENNFSLNFSLLKLDLTESQTSVRLTLINLFLISVEQKDSLKTERGPTSTDPERLPISDTKSQRRTCHVSC